MDRRLFPIFISILLISTSSMTPKADDGNIIYVDDDNISGPWDGTIEHPYQHIQDAIDNASNGDTIFVYSGVYYGDILINKSITLIGEDRNTTIIHNSSSGFIHDEVIYVISNNVVISGFTIENIMDYGRGIKLKGVENCCLENTCIRDNGYGVSIVDSINCRIIDNIVIRNHQKGISIADSTNCIIASNLIKDNKEGIYITSSSSCIVSSNLVYRNSYGIELISSYNCSVTGNTMIESGIFLYGSLIKQFTTHKIDANTVNGKPVYYLKDMNNGSLSLINVGEVILINCSDFEIRDIAISDTTVGIEITYSTRISARDIAISDTTVGIEILYSSKVDVIDTYLNCSSIDVYYSDGIQVYNSEIMGNERDSISFYYSTNNSIYDTIISGGSYGISFAYSTGNSIRDCYIYSSRYACISFSQSSGNLIYNCLIINDAECITLYSYSTRNSFKYCRISSRYSIGVYLEDFSNRNKFYRCNISDSLYGVILALSHDNKFFENNFIGNLEDVYFYNSFFNTWLRNYWSNWNSLIPKPLKGCIYIDFDVNLHLPMINFDLIPAKKPYDTKKVAVNE